jgi:hypothetical protein
VLWRREIEELLRVVRASCDDQAAHRCVEHHQENLKMGTARAEGKCKRSPTGTFAAVACPTAGLIGRCTTALEIENYYTGAPMNEAELKAACDGRGTFSKP